MGTTKRLQRTTHRLLPLYQHHPHSRITLHPRIQIVIHHIIRPPALQRDHTRLRARQAPYLPRGLRAYFALSQCTTRLLHRRLCRPHRGGTVTARKCLGAVVNENEEAERGKVPARSSRLPMRISHLSSLSYRRLAHSRDQRLL
jgi:hypothetical protein